MGALPLSAQIWVPWLGVAGLLAAKAWLRTLGVAAPSGRPLGDARTGYFLAFSLALIAPLVIALALAALSGGPASLGPLILFDDPGTPAARLDLLASLAAAPFAYGVARAVFASRDATAYAVAAAGATMLAGRLDWPVLIALALALGALGQAWERAIGTAPAAIGASAGMALAAAFALHGNAAAALVALSVVAGLTVAALAAARSAMPIFIFLAPLPALGLAALAGEGSLLDLSARLSAPAAGSLGSLVLMFALVPALAAPFVWLPALLARQARRARGWAEPLFLVAELAAAAVCSVLVALALSAGAALFSRLHELSGGGSLLRVQTLLEVWRAAPFAPSQLWLAALVALPFAAPILHALALVARVLKIVGLTRLADAAALADRVAFRCALLVAVVIALAASTIGARTLARHELDRHARSAAVLSGTLVSACTAAAQTIAAWRGF